jgi:hypothetical protein
MICSDHVKNLKYAVYILDVYYSFKNVSYWSSFGSSRIDNELSEWSNESNLMRFINLNYMSQVMSESRSL